ncbi:MAG: SNF2-related protein, partial [Aquificaceae bacterium]|nr:SNF2-related protein [Aquificaceae bacterium]
RVLPNLFITGSSNLTKAGLSLQEEFNVEVKDYGFEEAEKYFNHLWTNSVELTEKDVKQILEVIETQTMLKEITPFEAYAYLLKLYLELHAGEVPKDLREFMEEKGYRPFTYQLEAVSQAVANIKIHNGTLIADVVGLGKTVIACLTAKALGGKGIVICPPHLIGNENAGWLKYLEDFELYHWKVFSLGNLRGALNYVCKRPDIQVVIVDEAHRFRNEKTQRYHLLREICRGKQVILLTATPFNNRPSDLFSLIKLFTVPQKSSIVLDEDLYSKFAKYESEYKKIAYIRHYHNSKKEKQREKAKAYYRSLFHNELFITEIDLQKVNQRAKNLSKKIKHILNPVVIRRNRLDLKHYEEKIDLPEVKDPQEWFFELTKEQLGFYDEVIQSFAPLEEGGRFAGAIYYPARYENEDKEDKFDLLYQSNLYGFMRKLMVKRFESSLGAFLQSLRNFKEAHIKVLEFATKTNHFVLDERLMKNLLEETEEEEIERKLKEYAEEEELEKEQIKKYHKVYKLSQFKRKKEFLQDIEKDIALFEHLEKRIEKLGLIKEEPK